MNESFLKFKKKIYKEVGIKSFILGLSLSIIVISLILIICKINAIGIHFIFYILMALGLYIIFSLLFYFLLRPNNKKVAKRVDKEFNLNEKVQTMIAFDHKEGPMIALQREDTQEKLESISPKKLPFRFHIFHFIIPIVSCILCITALVIPLKAASSTSSDNQPAEEDKPFESSDEMLNKLRKLIEYVRNSDLENSVKDKFVDELYNLLVEVVKINTESEKNQLVLKTISNINSATDAFTTNKEISTVLSVSENTNIAALALSINALNLNEINIIFDEIKAGLVNKDSSINVLDLHNSFGKLLEDSSLDKEETLYKLLSNLSNNIKSVSTSDTMDEEIASIFNDLIPKIMIELERQSDIRKMDEYVEKELRDIFGLPKENIENPDDKNPSQNPDEENPDDKKDEEENPSGGMGSGEILFGSDDMFFDPEKGYIKYSDVIYEYHGNIMALIEDGIIPKEYETYINEYFQILYGGKAQENVEN